MQLKRVLKSSTAELDKRAGAFFAACGYEHRSIAMSSLITSPRSKVAICFQEWTRNIARPSNEKTFKRLGFSTTTASGGDSLKIFQLAKQAAERPPGPPGAVGFDISSMTRPWHGGIIHGLRAADGVGELETFFAYVPALFTPAPKHLPPNEIVAPVAGFASLAPPDLPIAAVIGLGYDRERALGLQQYLDPVLTLLMIPKHGEGDPYYAELCKNNRGLLDRTDRRWVFEYDLGEPAATFATLASIVAGLRETYRVVLVSLGPKIFGLLTFLLATRFRDVSVWRVSAGTHGKPRDADADLSRAVVLSAIWEPQALRDPDSR